MDLYNTNPLPKVQETLWMRIWKDCERHNFEKTRTEGIFCAWQNCCTHKVTTAVVAFTRSAQNHASHHSNLEGKGILSSWLFFWKVIDSCVVCCAKICCCDWYNKKLNTNSKVRGIGGTSGQRGNPGKKKVELLARHGESSMTSPETWDNEQHDRM